MRANFLLVSLKYKPSYVLDEQQEFSGELLDLLVKRGRALRLQRKSDDIRCPMDHLAQIWIGFYLRPRIYRFSQTQNRVSLDIWCDGSQEIG